MGKANEASSLATPSFSITNWSVCDRLTVELLVDKGTMEKGMIFLKKGKGFIFP